MTKGKQTRNKTKRGLNFLPAINFAAVINVNATLKSGTARSNMNADGCRKEVGLQHDSNTIRNYSIVQTRKLQIIYSLSPEDFYFRKIFFHGAIFTVEISAGGDFFGGKGAFTVRRAPCPRTGSDRPHADEC